MMHKTILFIDGSKTSILLLKYLIKAKKFDIRFIMLSPNCDEKINITLKKKFKDKLYISNLKDKKIVKKLSLSLSDIAFSYYDNKIPEDILNSLKVGGINFHPSFLPYNKGRHSTFWAINQSTPFGATAHWLNNKFDEGDIFIQKEIKFNNFENAKIIYNKQLKVLEEIIITTIDFICNNKFFRKKQNNQIKDYHFAWDIKKLSTINLNKKISNINLGNLIRSTCYNNNTGFNIVSNSKVYFIVSKYLVKKKKYKNKYIININEIYKNISNTFKFNYKINIKNFEIKVFSKITKITNLD
jgi:methionyl-tRNA formyltransferase